MRDRNDVEKMKMVVCSSSLYYSLVLFTFCVLPGLYQDFFSRYLVGYTFFVVFLWFVSNVVIILVSSKILGMSQTLFIICRIVVCGSQKWMHCLGRIWGMGVISLSVFLCVPRNTSGVSWIKLSSLPPHQPGLSSFSFCFNVFYYASTDCCGCVCVCVCYSMRFLIFGCAIQMHTIQLACMLTTILSYT